MTQSLRARTAASLRLVAIGVDGGIVRAADLHAASLAALSDLFAVVKEGDSVPD